MKEVSNVKTTQKILAFLLCMCMVLSVVPAVQAAAAEAVSNEPFEIYNENAEPRGWSITSLSDSGLDEAGADWAGSYTFGIVKEEDGNTAIAINKNSIGYAALTTPSFAVQSGNNYRLSFAYRNNYVGAKDEAQTDLTFWGMRITVHFYDADGAELTTAYKTVNNSVVGGTVSENWTQVTYDFEAAAGAASAKVFFGLGGQKNAVAQMLIDDYSISAYAADELPNGDFNGIVHEKDGARDAGVDGPATWDVISANINGNTFNTSGYENKYVISTVEENGDKVMELKPLSAVQGYAVAHSAYVKAEENATYVLKYDQKTTGYDVKDGAAYRGARVFLYFYDSNKAMLGYQEQSVKEIQDWTTKTLTATTPEGTAYLAIGLYIGGVWNSAGGFAYYYDDISLTKIDFNGDFEFVNTSGVPYSWTKTSMTSDSKIETENNWAANYTLAAAAGEGVNGSTAASLTKNSTGYAALTSIPVAASAGSAYRITYSYKTTSIAEAVEAADFYGIHAVAEFIDADGNTVTDGWIVLNNTSAGKGQTVSSDWETVVHDVIAPAGAVSVRVYLAIGGKYYVKATVLFDDVTVTQYAADAVVNADFDGTVNEALGGRNGATEGPAGWTAMTTNSGGNWDSAGTSNYMNNYAITTVTEADGNKVMKIAPCTTSTGTRGYIVAYSQPMAVEAATTYTLTYDQKIDVGESSYNGAKIMFYYFDENMEYIAGDWKGSSTAEHDWQAMSNTITTRANTAYMIVGFFMGGAWDKNPGIAYYYDDIAVVKNPATYTVTYVADDVTVDTYTVEAGADSPAIPKIPAKVGYAAAWDHDGTNITADTTITAVYTQDVNVVDWGIVLGEDIGVKIRLQIGKANVSATSVVLTVNGVESNASLRAEDDYYVVNAKMAAAQMTDSIGVKITCGDVVIEKSYSVLDYAMTILEGEYDDVTKALVAEMLNYGAAAQEYFGYNQEAAVNTDLLPEGTGSQEIDPAAAEDMVIVDSVDGISFYGATLLFKSKTAVRFYFTVIGDISGYTFAAGETALTPVEKDGLYYVEIGNINPQDLANQITVTVTAGEQALTVSYGPMNYVVRKNAAGSDNLKALVKAMYNYYLAAVAYVNAAA